MEKKNMVLLTVIAIATLLVAVVGATFAYFTATVNDSRDAGSGQGEASLQATKVPGNLTIEKSDSTFGKFTAENVYPGHKELIELKITSDKNNTENTYFNIVYEGTNTFPTDTIKFQIYESLEPISGIEDGKAYDCIQDSEAKEEGNGEYKLFETCTLKEALNKVDGGPATPVATTQLQNLSSSQKVKLNGDHPFVITGTSSDRTVYYYIVAEYRNLETSQNETDKTAKLTGKITVEMATRDDNAIADSEDKLIDKTE